MWVSGDLVAAAEHQGLGGGQLLHVGNVVQELSDQGLLEFALPLGVEHCGYPQKTMPESIGDRETNVNTELLLFAANWLPLHWMVGLSDSSNP